MALYVAKETILKITEHLCFTPSRFIAQSSRLGEYQSSSFGHIKEGKCAILPTLSDR